jgi:hypothetical protein
VGPGDAPYISRLKPGRRLDEARSASGMHHASVAENLDVGE